MTVAAQGRAMHRLRQLVDNAIDSLDLEELHALDADGIAERIDDTDIAEAMQEVLAEMADVPLTDTQREHLCPECGQGEGRPLAYSRHGDPADDRVECGAGCGARWEPGS
jgi:hypothetical protein